MKNKDRKKSPFRLRNFQYSAVIVFVILLMLAVNDGVRLYFVRQNAKETDRELNALDERVSERRLQREKQLVEIAVQNFSKLAEQYIKDGLPDSLYSVARMTLESNLHISNSGIAFRHGYFPNKVSDFFLFAYRDADTILTGDYRTLSLDFYNRDWYKDAVTKKESIWTEPYQDYKSGNSVMTYAMPLWDPDGEVMAVFYADMPMTWVKEVSEVRSTLRLQNEKLQHRLVVISSLLILVDLLLLGLIFWSAVRLFQSLRKSEESEARIMSELRVAGDIQRGLLQDAFPVRDDIACFATLTPARQVGGDLYDYHLRDEKFFFCIGDVSGKGVPASLMMAVVSSAFRTLTDRQSKPEQIVSSMNKIVIASNSKDMFVTLFLGVLDLPTGRLRFCNAGQGSPLLFVKGDDEKSERFESIEVISNLPIGVLDNFVFKEQEIQLPDEASILLYTDGLTEARNAKGDQYTEQRVLEVAQKIAQSDNLTPQNIISTMKSEVCHFTGATEISDDLTMLALQYRKPQYSFDRMRSVTLPCDIKHIPELNAFVQDVAKDAGMEGTRIKDLQLAAEELVVNAMSYAYPIGRTGDVLVEAFWDDKMVRLRITDKGKPFDPTALPEADINLPAEERNVGGLGVHLVRMLTDSINYERIDEMNVLTISKLIK